MKISLRCFILIALTFNPCRLWADDQLGLRALLVGIGTYQNASGAGLRTLYGPSNDVKAMHDVLADRFGLTVGNTTVLLNEQAPRSAVLTALKKVLVEDAKPGEVALFYFAGHGSRVFDTSTDEPSKSDSTILPYDARADTSRVLDITDDELRGVVAASIAKGVKPVVILDSCYSGTGIRFLAQARFAPAVVRGTARDRPHGEVSVMREIAAGHGTMLAAAQETEEALETERDGMVMGEFTRVLVSVLRRSEPGAAYLDVLTRVRVGLAELGVPHRPQGEGNLQQRFLGTGPLGRPPIIAEVIDGRTARLQVGASSGVTVGSEYDFYASAAAATAKASPIASGKVMQVGPDSADVHFTAEATPPATIFAAERSHAYGNLKLGLAINGGTEQQQRQIRDALAKLDYVSIVPSGSATYWLQLGAADVQLVRADGSKIGPRRPLGANLDEQLAILLGRLAHFQALLRLTNPAKPASPISARIVLASASSDDLKNPVLRDGEALLQAGETFKISLFNNEARARHVYLLNLASNLCVTLLSPPPFGVDQPLVGLARTKLLKAGPELGREYFLILATDTPVALEALQQPCLDAASLRSGTLKTYTDPLAQLLRDAGAARRGPKRNLPLDGWSTGFLTMIVE